MTAVLTPPMIAPPAPPPAQPGTAAPTLLTADEFEARYPESLYDLIKGKLKERPMAGFEHGWLCFLVSRLIGNFAIDNNLGRVITNDTRVELAHDPDSVLGMDVAYISYSRLPKSERPSTRLAVAPELVVEVRSPSEAWTEVMSKAVLYLQAGVTVVLIVDPVSVSVSEYRDDVVQRTYFVGDTLTLDDVLPGFRLAVADLFA